MYRCVGAWVHRFSTDAWMQHGCSMDARMWLHGGMGARELHGYSMDAARMHRCRDAAWTQHGCTGMAFEMAAQPQEVLTHKPQERLQ